MSKKHITEMVYRSLDEIKKHPRNPRTIKDTSFKKLVKSIDENPDFFEARPIILSDRTGELIIIGGNQRYAAAKELGFKHVPTVLLPALTEEKEQEIMIRDNIANGDWDFDILANEWDASLLNEWGLDVPDWDKEAASAGLTDPDDVPEAEENPVTAAGDLWVLGNHRLLCGDSTDKATVELLMNGQKADMVFTDPPYNVAFNGRSGKFDVIKNDDLEESDFDDFILSFSKIIKQLSPKNYYIWCNWKFYSVLQTKLDFKGCIVWAKNVFGLGRGYRHQHEFCLYNATLDQSITNESDLWSVSKDSNYVHPTQKPVDLSLRALRNHPDNMNIIDLFGGSGSTLIGCEQENRICFLMELDPKYCDVIINRWQSFTGQTATLESTGQTFEQVKAERHGSP